MDHRNIISPTLSDVIEQARVMRLDQAGRYCEQIGFTVVSETRVFSVAYMPREAPVAGVVICPPLLMDLLKNYRREVLLARRLASQGIAVERFHYRGTGHSEGAESNVSSETLVEDALAAALRLQRAGVRKIAFFGARWGARVAATTAAQYPGAPLVFWEPVIEAPRYLRELIMARVLREASDARFAEPGAGGMMHNALLSAERWEQKIAHEGLVDVLGYPLTRGFYASAMDHPPLDEVIGGAGPRAVLLVQIGLRETLRPELTRLRRAIEAASGTCDIRLIRDEPGWMSDGHRLRDGAGLLRMSTDWLAARMRGTASG